MGQQVRGSCHCGEVKFSIDKIDDKNVNHMKCYCTDCQTYAHALNKKDEVLCEIGGTSVVQMAPSQFQITAGKERVKCMRLSLKGAMRFYASCCDTPIANTLLSPNMLFVGLVVPSKLNGFDAVKQALGPVDAHVQCAEAQGPVDEKRAFEGMPKSIMAGFMKKLVMRKIRGEQKKNVFAKAGAPNVPFVEPEIFSKEKRNEIRCNIEDERAAKRTS